jgi:aminopeptidase N
MSTYLVAIAVCDYVQLRGTTAKGVKVGVYAPSDQISKGGLALNTALQVLTYYEEFFGVAYPMPKLGTIHLDTIVKNPSVSFVLVYSTLRERIGFTSKNAARCSSL